MEKFVYDFEEGSKELKPLLGGKGANLSEMKKIGLPVPEGFVITTDACLDYIKNDQEINDAMEKEIFDHLKALEERTDKSLGDPDDPLLVSVRSGAVISMPGMMDTVLNLGLNDQSVQGLAELTDNERFAYDSYRRFIQMFSDVVMGVDKYKFDNLMHDAIGKNVDKTLEITIKEYKILIEEFKKLFKEEVGFDFPQEPKKQLMMAIRAVFDSWNNERAVIYRNTHDIPHDLGTAVNIQSMVFGNMGDTSGTGVAFTRNPATGEKKMYGEFLINAQGEDVVAGIRTPREISELQEIMPEVYKEFKDACDVLEEHYKDIQDIEFTIERGKLYFLQTRTAKRTADAAIKAAVDMVEEGLITETDAVLRIDPKQIEQLLHPKFDEEDLETAQQLAKGLPASPGAATGKVYFTSEAAVEASKNGEKVILVRTETSPEDIEGMVSSEGILTARGGMTSHAAVVARGMGKCCIAGCGEIKINEKEQYFLVKGEKYEQGHYISLNGSTGVVYNGKVKTKEQELTGDFAKIMTWVDERRELKIRTNADNPMDSETAVKFGAEGIGLCRTEHMFFKDDRITSVRKMIIASNTEERKEALQELLPHQIEDFEGIFEVMEDRPVTIRLLDPPLHEFLPNEDEEIEQLAIKLNTDYSTLKDKVLDLKEFNPMLGHRGCRLAITYPEIYEMQVRAIFEAAISISRTKDKKIEPEVMIPLVGHLKEFTQLKKLVNKIAQEVMDEQEYSLDYKVGTMIEVPRAALISDKIAEEADFFSFGTNDLTQMTLGFSRDDAGKFIDSYVSQEILPYDPFKRIDFEGVGQLMELSVEKGRSTHPTIKLGICGEHGGEPESVKYCHRLGLDYVSCSPFRIPSAKLAAAHVALEEKE